MEAYNETKYKQFYDVSDSKSLPKTNKSILDSRRYWLVISIFPVLGSVLSGNYGEWK